MAHGTNSRECRSFRDGRVGRVVGGSCACAGATENNLHPCDGRNVDLPQTGGFWTIGLPEVRVNAGPRSITRAAQIVVMVPGERTLGNFLG